MKVVTTRDEAFRIVNGTQKHVILYKGDMEEEVESGITLQACTEDGVEYAELTVVACWLANSSGASQRVIDACGCKDAIELQHLLDESRAMRLEDSEAMMVAQVSFNRLVSATSFESSEFWSKMNAEKIPSKKHLHPSFIGVLQGFWQQRLRFSMLDLGCGDGHVALQLLESAGEQEAVLDVMGVDVCESAVKSAREMAGDKKIPEFRSSLDHSTISFIAQDVTKLDVSSTHGLFDVVLCQLVISVVGGKKERKALLQCIFSHLKEGHAMLLSVSGASEHVNESYRKIYEEDEGLTGEYRSYLSRGSEGQVLYITHHFTEEEIVSLCKEVGFCKIAVHKEIESSSRRPKEKAIFLYVIAYR